MRHTINVKDLPEEEIKFVQELVEFLKVKVSFKRTNLKKKEEISFAEWELGSKGNLTRGEIYENL